MNGWNWNWEGWGYGFGIAFASILGLAVALVPVVFFLLNLRDLLHQVRERNRAMTPGHVWLNLIPVFGLGWFLYTVIKVRDSVQAEYRSRGWTPNDDLGYSVGIAAGAAAIAVLVLGWSPFFGWLIGLASLVCWIMYWVRTASLKNQLARDSAPRGSNLASPRSVYGGRGRSGDPEAWDRQEPRAGVCGSRASGATDTQADDYDDEGPVTEGAGDGRCPACGFACDEGDRFCRSCGTRLPL